LSENLFAIKGLGVCSKLKEIGSSVGYAGGGVCLPIRYAPISETSFKERGKTYRRWGRVLDDEGRQISGRRAAYL